MFAAARVTAYERVKDVLPVMIERTCASVPGLEGANGYWDFAVPVLPADYVTDDAGTGFVHTAPGHGADDYNTFIKHKAVFEACGTPQVPHTVSPDSSYFPDIPFFAGERVYDDKGKDGGRQRGGDPQDDRSRRADRARSPEAPISAFLAVQGAAAVPQYAAMVHRHGQAARQCRAIPCGSARSMRIKTVEWVPESGENRITGMIENRPDWVVSRQRAWGVPIAVFVRRGTSEILKDERVNAAIADAFEKEGADAWYEDDGARFLAAGGHKVEDFDKIDDILDVWFDSGCTHAFALEKRDDLKVTRKVDGGPDQVMYLEGSDQHRGWFHSSLLESCGTRGRAPYDIVLTHGFVLDEKGQKMSKSIGNVVAPQKVIQDSGADILRLWVAASDYSDDLRIGPEILKTFVETYRKLRNTIRWMLGSLGHFNASRRGRGERHAGARTLRAASPCRTRRRDARGLWQLRLQARHRAAELVPDQRPVGVLFRYPQGRALLRTDLEPCSQKRSDGDRHHASAPWRRGSRRSLPSRPRRRGLHAIPMRNPCISRLSRTFRRNGGTMPSRRAGRRSAACAAW